MQQKRLPREFHINYCALQMHDLLAEIKVLEVEVLTLKGLQLSSNLGLVKAAKKRTELVQIELDDLRSQFAAKFQPISSVEPPEPAPENYP